MGKFVLFPDVKGEPRNVNAATLADFADPAAGADFSYAIPVGGGGIGPQEIWRPLIFTFELVTAVAVANRYIRFNIGETQFIFSSAVTASQNWRIRAQNMCTYRNAPGAVAGWYYGELWLPEVYLQAGETLATSIISLQAADQIQNVRLHTLVYRDRTV